MKDGKQVKLSCLELGLKSIMNCFLVKLGTDFPDHIFVCNIQQNPGI